MAEALWALGSASALRAWVGLSRPAKEVNNNKAFYHTLQNLFCFEVLVFRSNIHVKCKVVLKIQCTSY